MDIRNITKPAPIVEKDAYLEQLFLLQKDLMENYIRIEGLPRYPLNINSKKSQIVLKDFSARVTEELAEGYESTSMVIEMLDKVGFNTTKLSPAEYQMMLNHLQNSNEEQADATAFYIELMIYADITPSDIRDFLYDQGITEDNQGPLLEKLMVSGVILLAKDNSQFLELPLNYNILQKDDFENSEKYKEVIGYIPAFREISPILHEYESGMLWQVCYHLGVARNYLKNKPWKQSGELTDEVPFIKEVIMGFIKYMGYICHMGFTPETLYNLFWRKHCVNQFRINSGY